MVVNSVDRWLLDDGDGFHINGSWRIVKVNIYRGTCVVYKG